MNCPYCGINHRKLPKTCLKLTALHADSNWKMPGLKQQVTEMFNQMIDYCSQQPQWVNQLMNHPWKA